MNKKELIEKIDKLIAETKLDEDNSKKDIEKMFYIGKQNGLLWARLFILEIEEK